MRKLFWGVLFIYLNFSFNFNQHSLNVLPDFVGYILLLKGTEELREESGLFDGIRPFAVGMAVYTAVLWVGALLGVPSENWVGQILNVIGMVVALYISWVLIRAVREMEQNRAADLHGEKLYRCWKGMVVVQVAGKLLYLMVNLVNITVLAGLAALLALASLCMIAMYVVAWHQSTNAYEQCPVSAAEPFREPESEE